MVQLRENAMIEKLPDAKLVHDSDGDAVANGTCLQRV